MTDSTTDPTPAHVVTTFEDGVLTLVFNRPRQRNAMTWGMYEALLAACELASSDPEVKVLLLTSSADTAFVAGTDISQFQAFTTGADGLAYEERIAHVLGRLEAVSVPTVAAIRGYCVGGGLGIAAACDLRVATADAQFGVPIARTLGNCLSADTISRLLAHLGPGLTSEMLLRSRMVSGSEAAALGFVGTIAEDGALEATAARIAAELTTHAPLSMWAAKELIRRSRLASLPDDADVLQRVYSSQDFREGVAAFVAKRPAVWSGT